MQCPLLRKDWQVPAHQSCVKRAEGRDVLKQALSGCPTGYLVTGVPRDICTDAPGDDPGCLSWLDVCVQPWSCWWKSSHTNHEEQHPSPAISLLSCLVVSPLFLWFIVVSLSQQVSLGNFPPP